MNDEDICTQSAVMAEILCLSASILLGKATREEIEEVGELAKKHGCFNVFADEIKDCDRIINAR